MDVDGLTRLDFDFHLMIAMASDNLSYPLLLNSFKPVYTNLSGQFFADPGMAPIVHGFHEDLVEAVANRDVPEAMAVMRQLLAHGENRLMAIITT